MRTILTDVEGWTPLIDVLVQEIGLIGAAVFGRVWRYCQAEKKVCNATMDTIADELGLRRQAVHRYVKRLCELGYIEDTTPGLRNHPHTYRDTGGIVIEGLLVARRATVSERDSAVSEKYSAVSERYSGCILKVHEDTRDNKRDNRRDKKEPEAATPPPPRSWTDLAETRHPTDRPPSPLDPASPEERELFDSLRLEAQAKGRRAPQARFGSLKQAEKFRQAVTGLNGQFSAILQRGLEKEILSRSGLISYIAGAAARIAAERESTDAPPAGKSRLTPEQLAAVERRLQEAQHVE